MKASKVRNRLRNEARRNERQARQQDRKVKPVAEVRVLDDLHVPEPTPEEQEKALEWYRQVWRKP